jgi:hypothetical protein
VTRELRDRLKQIARDLDSERMEHQADEWLSITSHTPTRR